VKTARPFYTDYAWAFDLLIDRPVRKECATIAAWLIERGIYPGAEVLDAGCGTGRYAVELARRGYVVQGIDASPQLIAEAERACISTPGAVSVTVGDISRLPLSRYDAILCRGVLNDLVDEGTRQAVFAAFGRTLRPEGVLVLDVREWDATVERKIREPLFRKTVATDRGTLTFTSITELDPENHRLIVSEQHTLADDGNERSSNYEFVMRCWTHDELQSALGLAGFDRVVYFGAYDAAVAPGRTDRLVAVAQRSPAAA
jgi:SAM-dependent methyltransferase